MSSSLDLDTRRIRSDAVDNRRRILAVAQTAFAHEGLDVPLREIARRTGLGVATVHRHFPHREDLLSAVLGEAVQACVADVRAAARDPDPVAGLRAVVELFSDRQVRDRGTVQALLGDSDVFASQQRANTRVLGSLVDRAREDGALRDGTTVRDVRIALTSLMAFDGQSPAQARRTLDPLVGILVAGLLAPAPPPARKSTVERRVRRLR